MSLEREPESLSHGGVSRGSSDSGEKFRRANIVYRIVQTILDHERMTQEELAVQLGVKQAQISRWSSARSFSALCDRLRRYAQQHKDEWLRLMMSPEARTAFSDLENILFFTEDFFIPQETWVVSERPAELDRKSLRDKTVDALKNRAVNEHSPEPFLVYWVPASKKEVIRELIVTFQLAGIELSSINDQIRVIETPEYLSFLPLTIVRPHSDDRVGFVSPWLESSSGLRLSVLPQETTDRLYARLRSVYNALILSEGNEYNSLDGSSWRLIWPKELEQ